MPVQHKTEKITVLIALVTSLVLIMCVVRGYHEYNSCVGSLRR